MNTLELRLLMQLADQAAAWRRAEKRHALIVLEQLKGDQAEAQAAMEKALTEVRIATDKYTKIK